MKINTNLDPRELEAVGVGLQKLAKSQRETSYKPENNAEQELLRKTDHILDTMLESLQLEISDLLLK
jgi:hypothetical protein